MGTQIVRHGQRQWFLEIFHLSSSGQIRICGWGSQHHRPKSCPSAIVQSQYQSKHGLLHRACIKWGLQSSFSNWTVNSTFRRTRNGHKYSWFLTTTFHVVFRAGTGRADLQNHTTFVRGRILRQYTNIIDWYVAPSSDFLSTFFILNYYKWPVSYFLHLGLCTSGSATTWFKSL